MSKEKEFLVDFIEQYKSFSCLWKVKSKEYSDRNAKSYAYNVLVEKLQTVDPEANRESVVKKINSLRTAYRKELKKVVESEKSGAGEDIYVPHLWYFELLNFLKDQEIPRRTTSNIDEMQVNLINLLLLLFRQKALMAHKAKKNVLLFISISLSNVK